MIARLAALISLIALPVFAEVPVKEITSPNGIKAWLVEAPEIPFVALELRFKGGGSLDPKGKEGAVMLMSALLEEGTGDLDAQGFAAARDLLAAGYSFDSGRETLSVSARFLSENKEQSLALLRRALVEPAFPAEAIERVRTQMLAGIVADKQDPDAIARDLFNVTTFGEHPYARPVEGTDESVKSLTIDDLRAAHKAAVVSDRIYVAAVGDITEAELGKALDTLLAGLPKSTQALPTKATVGLNGQIKVEPFPGPQSTLVFGHEGISRNDPDFFPAFVAAEILGGGRFGTRLMAEVREKRGLTYGIGAGFSSLDQAELYTGQFKTANGTVKQAIDVIRAEWARIPEITQEELDATKTYLTGSYPLRWDGNADIAEQLVSLQMDGYDVDYPAKRNGYIEAVTLEDARRVAAKVFDPKKLTFLIVGSPEGLEQE